MLSNGSNSFFLVSFFELQPLPSVEEYDEFEEPEELEVLVELLEEVELLDELELLEELEVVDEPELPLPVIAAKSGCMLKSSDNDRI